MREDLLHFIWQYKLANTTLLSSQNEEVHVRLTGTANFGEGPDFFNAQLEVDGQLWAGNVEIHIKASDWYAHHHETDTNYDNVILHVVWDDDIPVFRKDKSQIPTVELKHIIPPKLLSAYQKLMDNSVSSFINCERELADVDTLIWTSWSERLYIERLEQKSVLITKLLENSKNDWEAVLFQMLCKSFGTKVNGPFFLERAQELDFSVVRKTAVKKHVLESLLFGHFGLLDVRDCQDLYFLNLGREYSYLKQKFSLNQSITKPAFYGIRPVNFPTIRISQLSGLYHKHRSLFQTLVEITAKETFYDIFQVFASSYWDNHFTFGKVSRKSKKKVSVNFIDLLLINIVVPLKFCYAKHLGQDWNEELIQLLRSIRPETNAVVTGFDRIGMKSQDAMESQSKLQLHQHYCSKNRCLQCAVGTHLLNRNTYF
ncbi:DUF2851 family protein [Flagellimonas allohymeniacidonis]|uniref:DUF2851 family protein n=1 Tax=Flagellimonas allohymeniacidonis TaxID=2517819 RepID=A0A4V2HS86_9FLAO|nr:DUF2851 family protein [Allomuricauda hymeniacidonis]TAI46720.1 DUF2851 family protein [Allomuricauda hymeniacidonis]